MIMPSVVYAAKDNLNYSIYWEVIVGLSLSRMLVMKFQFGRDFGCLYSKASSTAVFIGSTCVKGLYVHSTPEPKTIYWHPFKAKLYVLTHKLLHEQAALYSCNIL